VTTVGYRYRDQFAEAARLAQSRHAGVWMGL
jgi:endonuclease YncB( thermonuclease family)